jgi:hypothetical protein
MVEGCGLDIGPFGDEWKPSHVSELRSWLLTQIALGKLVLRLDVDLSIWWAGYFNYGWDEHGYT